MSAYKPRIYYNSSACIDEGSGAAAHSRGICCGLAKLTEVIPILAYSKLNTLNRIIRAGMPIKYLFRTKLSQDGSVNPWRRLIYTIKFFINIAAILLTYPRSDRLFYVRWTYFSFPLIALMVIFREKYFLEENAKDEAEQLSMGRKFRPKITSFLESIAISHAEGVFCVTDEISRYICKRYNYPSQKTKVVPNGVELGNSYSDVPCDNLRSILKVRKSSDFLIGFVGSGNYNWHGIKEITQLVNGLKDHKIHLVIFGQKPEGQCIPRTHFMGYIDEVQLFPWLQDLDLAFASMNSQVKGITQACPIKVGLYLKSGLPVIINYDDVRFKGDEHFVLNLSKVDRTQWLYNLKKFIEYIRKNRERIRQSAQQFAYRQLSWDKMAKYTYDFIISTERKKFAGG